MPIAAAGFTILEVLVALTVLGLVVAVLFQGIAGGLRRTSYEEGQLALVLEAERLMARIDLDLGSGDAVRAGDDGNLRWRIERRPIQEQDGEEQEEPEPGEASKVMLVEYTITVEGLDGRNIIVRTRRVRAAEGGTDAAR